jgi:SAM-dependent methyltransferase
MFEPASYGYFEDVNWGLLRLWNGRSELDVLDAGCGYATTSERIARCGNRVTGIESHPGAAAVARTRVGDVVEADLSDLEAVRRALGGKTFDVVIFADVLEHLAWPVGVLRAYTALLRDEGSVIVSLPNVGLWSVRLSLLFGNFAYDDSGVLDRTHLRFFTRRTARQLLEAAGLVPIATEYNPGMARPFVPLARKIMARKQSKTSYDPASILNSPAYRAYLRTVYPIERVVARLYPGLLAFQMIFEAKRKR